MELEIGKLNFDIRFPKTYFHLSTSAQNRLSLLPRLEPGEMKKFIIDYVLLTQDLIDKYHDLDDLVAQAIQQEEST